MSDDGHSLWQRVCATVRPLSQIGKRHRSKPATMGVVDYNSIDLHGHTVASAHVALVAFLDQSAASGKRRVTVVTGKSGQIRQECPVWLELSNRVTSFDILIGDGAFLVRLR